MNFIIILLAYGLPLCMAIGFFIGYRVANKEETIQKTDFKINLTTKKKIKETAEQKAQRIFNENIENFGTAIPQQEV